MFIMKLVAQIQLLPSFEQAQALRQTLSQANAACQFVSDIAWDTQTFRQYDLHHRGYRDVRERFGLSAQLAVRVIAKVADAYKLDRNTKRTFKPTGSLAFDDRILSWRLTDRTVSIWTVKGRLHIPFICGEPQWELLQIGRRVAVNPPIVAREEAKAISMMGLRQSAATSASLSRKDSGTV